MRGSCIAGFWTQGFSTIYRGKLVASRFGQMVDRIQDWRVLIPFDNRVYHLPKLSQFRLTKNGRKSLKLIFKTGLKTWNPNFGLEVSNQENRECLLRRSVCFRNFQLKRRKQPESALMVSLAKHQSVFLVCFNGSYKESCSRFMIHTRCHTSK